MQHLGAYALIPLVQALYTADHPGPLEQAMALVGQAIGGPRSPLQGAKPEALEQAALAIARIRAVEFG